MNQISEANAIISIANERDRYRQEYLAVAESEMKLMAERDMYKEALELISRLELWEGLAMRIIAHKALGVK